MKDLFVNVYDLGGNTVLGAPRASREEAKLAARLWSSAVTRDNVRRLYLLRVRLKMGWGR